MEKVDRPKGLIRYASENNIVDGTKPKWTARMIGYSVVLFLLLGALVTLMVTRKDFDAQITRAQGQLYQERDSLHYSNLYNVKLLNKTNKEFEVEFRLEESNGVIEMVTHDNLLLPAEDYTQSSFFIVLDSEEWTARKMGLWVGVYSDGKKIETVKTSFFGPVLN